MSDTSTIEWTRSDDGSAGATWNPVVGCTHVSPGCDNCYAARLVSGRLRHLPTYAGLAEGGRFTGEVRLLPDRLEQPLKWRKPRRVFVNSMSDLFHDAVPDEYIARVWQVMAATPQHTYQVLTKRHGRMRAWFRRWPNAVMKNLWLGVSVEDQARADLRIPALLGTPATARFVSAEPLLGPVDLTCWLKRQSGLDWVICGGESGPGARPMDAGWARDLRDQCQAAGVPFFMKQAGAALAREWGCSDRKGHDPDEWPEPFPREFPGGAS